MKQKTSETEDTFRPCTESAHHHRRNDRAERCTFSAATLSTPAPNEISGGNTEEQRAHIMPASTDLA